MGHIDSEGQGLVFKPIRDDTPEEFSAFLGDLQDTTEPVKHNNAWLRLWGHVKELATYAVKKFLYSSAAQEAITELLSRAMEVIYKKISGYKIQSKEKSAGQFCAWAKAIVNWTWLKLTSRHKQRSEKSERYSNEHELLENNIQVEDPDKAAFPRQGAENLLGLLDKFSEISGTNSKKAEVLRQAICIAESEPEISSIRGLAKRLKIDHVGLTRYLKAFEEFVKDSKRDCL